ncbi:MAG: type IA DNA topoisomerase, partial [Lachnospiraceae bacterium]|nr:type IA DNA topoisomerase [Lachnospiraceae bacterium]
MYRLFIAEKPSVAREFGKALGEAFKTSDGYMISDTSIVTWCVGHLITMSYPEVYDPALKKWSYDTIPFIPEVFRYEVLPDVRKQFDIVSGLLNRKDVDCIYICTDSGREGEYIYRLVDSMAGVPASKTRKRVWIDSQTEEEIKRGIREAKDWSEYDNLSDAAYLRAKEDFLMGINFSRVLTLKYGYGIRSFLGEDKGGAISVGRVMTCVLGMVVRREREIRNFDKTPYYRILGTFEPAADLSFEAEWRAVEGSKYFESPLLYKENGFKTEENANKLIEELKGHNGTVSSIETKKEKKKAPLLFNLAELQNECSKLFKISPDKTLEITQSLYEKKLVTYPRTDARVLSTAVAKEIGKNLKGLSSLPKYRPFLEEILKLETYKSIAKTQYTNDKMITDHYAIIPTGETRGEGSLDPLSSKVFDLIVRRFLAIFYPPAEYLKAAVVLDVNGEKFFANFKALEKEGYLAVAKVKKEGPEEKEASSAEAGAKQDEAAPGKEDKDPEEDREQIGGIE